MGVLFGLSVGRRSPADRGEVQTRLTDTHVITKKVLAIAFDPLLPDGTTLTNHLGWTPASKQAADHVDLFRRTSNNRAIFEVTETITVRGFP